jgi:hypothetical protein
MNPEKTKKHAAEYKKHIYTRLRNIVLNHYGKFCRCCGETNTKFLTLDHIDNGGNQHRKKVGNGIQYWRWFIKNEFPDGFQVLCYNCNCGRYRNNGVCPHKDTI